MSLTGLPFSRRPRAPRYKPGSSFRLLFALFAASKRPAGFDDPAPDWLPAAVAPHFRRMALALRNGFENPDDPTFGLGDDGEQQVSDDMTALFEAIGVPLEQAKRMGRGESPYGSKD
jgi:hypothetical protein